MSCFLMTAAGDLDVSSGNLVVVEDVPTCTAQKLTGLFGVWRGEWFKDKRIGIPMREYVLVKNPDFNVIRSINQQTIDQAPGAAAITSETIALDPVARDLQVALKVRTNDGAVLTGGPGVPFVVNLAAKAA